MTSPTPVSPLTPTRMSRLARSLRGSLHQSAIMTKVLSPKGGSAAGIADPTEESWTDSDYCHITTDDIPIPLDDPVTITPASSSLTLTVRTPGPDSSSRFSFTRLKNISRISIRRPRSIRFPFVNSSETRSILDQFPQPPSHIPTPITPAEYRWPQSAKSFAGEEQSYCREEPELSGKRLKNREKFKSLTRAFTRRRHHSSTKESATEPVAEKTTVVLSPPRPPRPNRPPPPTPVQERKIYQVVNPAHLSDSPSPFLGAELSVSARTSFVPPSPSWLSRNVQSSEREKDLADAPVIPGTPSSPSPLPIPPRILVSDCSDTPLLSPLEANWLEYPEVTGRQSFVSISARTDQPEALLLKPSTPFLSVPTPTAGIPSPLAIPSSPTPSDLEFFSRTSFYQLASELPDSPDSKPTLVSDSPPRRDIFVPALRPTDPDLPRGFSNLLSSLFIEAGLSLASSNNRMNFGKRNDVVDFGGEADYGEMEWFKEAPPAHLRPQPPVETVGTPYVPDSTVIEQNEAFEFALAAAPNVLYARFKQYGQLGVLAWCAEFGELIDNLKDLGFAGNMFVSTRTRALKTCEEILKLRLEIGMQIILLYLSSQIARLRRFLDGERAWNDYPEPSFPLDPNSYPK
jgi:hypothetical protein